MHLDLKKTRITIFYFLSTELWKQFLRFRVGLWSWCPLAVQVSTEGWDFMGFLPEANGEAEETVSQTT